MQSFQTPELQINFEMYIFAQYKTVFCPTTLTFKMQWGEISKEKWEMITVSKTCHRGFLRQTLKCVLYIHTSH